MGEDDFDWGSLFGGGDTDMSNFDMSGLDLGSLADFNVGDLNLSNLGDFNVGDLDLGNMDFGSIGGQGIDLNSILEGLQTDRVGGQNLDLESFLKDIEGSNAENGGLDLKALQDLMGNETDISKLDLGDLATNVGGAYDFSYNPDAPLKSTRSKNEAIASGNAPGSVGAQQLANQQLSDEDAQELYGTGSGLASLTGETSKNKAIASGTGPSSEGAKMLAEAASNSSSDNAFTPAEEAALFGKTPTNTSTGISKNEAIASGMSPGSAGAKAAAAGELSPEELAAAQGVVTKGSVYNPITSVEKTADALKKIADAKAAAAKTGSTGSGGNMNQLMMLLALMALMNKSGGGSSSGNATIPSLSAERKQLPYGGGSSSYRPGQGGVTYFTPTTYTTKAAGGGLMSLNGGGHLGGYSDGGRLLRGPGDGVSDSIPATIGGKQPARLATGEFVVPARIVSELGNGSTDAGAQRLYEMMDRVQRARRKTKNVAADTKAAKYLPA